MVAVGGCTGGAGGTVVRPAPRRAARTRCEPVRVGRVELDPARLDPIAAEATRFEEVTLDPWAPASGPAASTSTATPPRARAGPWPGS